jgi:hypothetical protein
MVNGRWEVDEEKKDAGNGVPTVVDGSR